MAVQNTNSAAFNQLRPLENNNIGAIVEEHIRYWKKYDDDAEALAKAQKAQQAEYARQMRKDATADLPEISVGDAVGMYKHQRVTAFEAERPELAALEEKYKQTQDPNILLKLQSRKQFYKSANDVTLAAESYSEYLLENEGKEYNPYLDKDKKKPWEALTKGQSVFDKTGFRVLNDKGEFDYYTPEQLNDHLLRLGRFSGNQEFDVSGKKIAEAIELKDSNGNLVLTPAK
jgi:hypothetical protein